MSDFITMVNRITTELRRSNMTAAAKNAVNDAIDQEAKTRYYFNEMRDVSFSTADGTEYYDDNGLTEIDVLYYFEGPTRYEIYPISNSDMDKLVEGNITRGQLELYSRRGQELRLFPIPSDVTAIYAEGYGKLSPWPLTLDDDTNAWLTTGERLIRAVAKSILLKDVIRDYAEATVLEAIAEDIRTSFTMETTTRIGTGQMRSTLW